MLEGMHALVGVGWLAQALQTPAPPIVLHVEWSEGGMHAPYLDGHVPGALRFDTDWLENGYPRWQLLPPDALQRRLGDSGLAPATPVVVYAPQYAMACRLWWVLRYCGATDVRVLAGGLDAWRAAGLPLSVQATHRTPTHFSARVRSELRASRDTALAAAQAGRLIDVRSSGEYLGLRSGYSYLERAGRIPGAVHADVEPLSALLDRSDLAGVAAYWRACGVLLQTGSLGGVEATTPASVFYCGSGWRSSVACLCAQLLGVPDARNYSEGWCGWSTHYVQLATAQSAQADALEHASTGGTPGWRQVATGNPIASG